MSHILLVYLLLVLLRSEAPPEELFSVTGSLQYVSWKTDCHTNSASPPRQSKALPIMPFHFVQVCWSFSATSFHIICPCMPGIFSQNLILDWGIQKLAWLYAAQEFLRNRQTARRHQIWVREFPNLGSILKCIFYQGILQVGFGFTML